VETNYRIAYAKYWREIKKKDPEEITAYTSATYDKNNCLFGVRFFESEYVMDCRNETIYRETDRTVPDITAAIIILNYLAYAGRPLKTTDKWVSLKELPDGGMLFYPAFHRNSIIPLIKEYGHRSQRLLQSAVTLGGEPFTFGNASAIFRAFPEIPLCVIIWEGDEEVNANATILFTPSVVDMLHIESVIGLGMYLADKLVKWSKNNTV
jgi:hypothetical protein